MLATQFQVTQPDTDSQDIHLPAVVVNVVLTLNRITRGLQNTGQAGAVRGAASVTDVQWPGGIGGYKFDGDFVILVRWYVSVAVTVIEDVFDNGG